MTAPRRPIPFLWAVLICCAVIGGRPGVIASRLRASYVADVHARRTNWRKPLPLPGAAPPESNSFSAYARRHRIRLPWRGLGGHTQVSCANRLDCASVLARGSLA
jgi:hypothetical protein